MRSAPWSSPLLCSVGLGFCGFCWVLGHSLSQGCHGDANPPPVPRGPAAPLSSCPSPPCHLPPDAPLTTPHAPQRAPYEAVVGKVPLASLKRQLRLQAMHAQKLADEGAGDKRRAEDDGKVGASRGGCCGVATCHTAAAWVGGRHTGG